MSEAARPEGRADLILSAEEWADLVVHPMAQSSATSLAEEIVRRVGSAAETEDFNRWLGPAMNIWNATPQPDRGGRTGYVLVKVKNPSTQAARDASGQVIVGSLRWGKDSRTLV
jgi:hypothetical protein